MGEESQWRLQPTCEGVRISDNFFFRGTSTVLHWVYNYLFFHLLLIFGQRDVLVFIQIHNKSKKTKFTATIALLLIDTS